MSSNPLPLKMFKPGGRNVGAPATNTGGMPPSGMDSQEIPGGKETGEQAGYMELDGAQKDADCSKVQVDGGVSSDLGCCNEFEPMQGATEFKCGTCTMLQKSGAPEEGAAPDASGNSQPVVTGQPS